MSQNPGWIQRVFGTKELEDRLQKANLLLAERDRRVLELDRRLQSAGAELEEKNRKQTELELELAQLRDAAHVNSTRASEHERELSDKLGRANQDRAALDAALTEARAKLAGMEGSLQTKLDRAMAMSKTAAVQGRRADQLAAELETLKRQLGQVESSAQGKAAEQARLAATIAEHERELSEKADLLSAAEWKIATLESELEQLRSELQRGKVAAVEQASTLEGLRHEHSKASVALGQRETVLALTKELLLDVLRLSANALYRTFGARSHLALELAARSCWRKTPESFHDDAHRALEIRDRLALIGITDEFSAAASGDGCRGRFRLSTSIPSNEATGVARWVAAYAIEQLHGASRQPLRLESLEGGPLEFEFLATIRADAVTVAIAEPTPALTHAEEPADLSV
jgi:hypothetical protein